VRVCVSPWAMAAAARYCGLSVRGPTRALLLAHGNTVELWNACWMMDVLAFALGA
jgi:hypothetical protein